MKITKTQKIIGSIVILIILLALYIAFDRRSQNAGGNPAMSASTTNQTTSTTTNTTVAVGGTQITTQGSGGYTITQVPVTESAGVPQPIPSMTAPVVFGTDP